MNGIYIPSLEAKDLYLANHFFTEDTDTVSPAPWGYELTTRSGNINLNKFISTCDYSLDLIKLRKTAKALLSRDEPFSFRQNDMEYSKYVINVTFRYSSKTFNKAAGNTYMKFGFDYRKQVFFDGICLHDNEVIGVLTDTKITDPITADRLPKGFYTETDENNNSYYRVKALKTLYSAADLRKELYKHGFRCEGIHYVRYKRSSGSSRVGKCLFIDERLYDTMHQWEMCGLPYEEGGAVDLAALEACISLPSSSIIGTLKISPKNILVIDDFESIFKEEAIVTEIGNDNWLRTAERETEIRNSIFDGQSLIDHSAMGSYSRYGMVLLRNLFFKSCCFNTNLRKWFADNHITKISQLNGRTLARNIKDITLITTPSSIKYLKFGSLTEWLAHIEPQFGVVKHDKKTHYFGGSLVQTHYQLLNTLQLTREETAELLQPSLNYVNLLNTDAEVFRHHIKCDIPMEDTDGLDNVMQNKSELVYKMLSLTEAFQKTKYYYDFKKETCKSYLKNLKLGHLLIDGNYSTLFGNPYEMLLHSIGLFHGQTSLPPGYVHTRRYPYGTDILGCRSPHVTVSNILLSTNMKHDLIDMYFNLTEEIICINAISENILERLSGADYDSDQMIITDHPVLIRAARMNYAVFKVPANAVNAQKVQRRYGAFDKADLDNRTCVNKIGEIINLSQELNTLLWERIYRSGKSAAECYEDIKELYHDICRLDIMSCIEIDKAKKEFSVNNASEVRKIKEKYRIKDSGGKTRTPSFLGFIAQTKGYYDPDKKNYQYHNTTMDYLLQELSGCRSAKTNASDFLPLCELFRPKQFDKAAVNYRQVKQILTLCLDTTAFIASVWAQECRSAEEKMLLIERARYDLRKTADALRLNPHTMYVLLTYTESKRYHAVSKILFQTLFYYRNSSFTGLFHILRQENAESDRLYLVPCETGEILLYNQRFTKKGYGDEYDTNRIDSGDIAQKPRR